jgi:hypothetical protein
VDWSKEKTQKHKKHKKHKNTKNARTYKSKEPIKCKKQCMNKKKRGGNSYAIACDNDTMRMFSRVVILDKTRVGLELGYTLKCNWIDYLLIISG